MDDATSWFNAQGLWINPVARLSVVHLGQGNDVCVVVDDVLANPSGMRAWAAKQVFKAPAGFPYPGLVAQVPDRLSGLVADHFSQQIRGQLGGRRTLAHSARLSLVTTPALELSPVQWLCHRDRVSDDPAVFFAASVLYLFGDEHLGGTSFYTPKQGPRETDQIVADSQRLDAASFSKRYGIQAGYMQDSNAYFERVVTVPAAWNRLIFYDGGLFHSADVAHMAAQADDPLVGRLTLNSFITCRRAAAA